jgi:hypothetical protein
MPTRKIAGFLCVLCLLAASACNNDTPASPAAPEKIDLTGRWRGDIIFAGQGATMQWTLTQTDASVTGEVLLLEPSGIVLLNGRMNGTLTGTTMPTTITVPAGGVPNRPTCTGTIAVTMYYNPGAIPTINGLMNVTQSTCPIALAAATGVTLARQ